MRSVGKLIEPLSVFTLLFCQVLQLERTVDQLQSKLAAAVTEVNTPYFPICYVALLLYITVVIYTGLIYFDC